MVGERKHHRWHQLYSVLIGSALARPASRYATVCMLCYSLSSLPAHIPHQIRPRWPGYGDGNVAGVMSTLMMKRMTTKLGAPSQKNP